MKDFVPYNEALALRDLGFDEPCFAFWDAYNGGTHLFFKQRVDYHWLLKLFGKTPKPILEITNWEIECLEGANTVSAPTFSQAFSFFREKYNLKGFISPVEYLDDTEDTYHWCIYNHFNSGNDQLTYEQAELECLRKLIEICKSK